MLYKKDRQREAESQGGRGEGRIGREMLYKKIDKERQRARVEDTKKIDKERQRARVEGENI